MKNTSLLLASLGCAFVTGTLNAQFVLLNDARSIRVSGPGYDYSQSPTSAFASFDGNVTGSGGANPRLSGSANQYSVISPSSLYVSNNVAVAYSYSSPGGSGTTTAENRFEITFRVDQPTFCRLSGYQTGYGEILSFPTISLRSTQRGVITSSSFYFPLWSYLGVLEPDTYILDLDSGLNWTAFYDQYLFHHGRIEALCRLTAIPPPAVTAHPANVTASVGGSANFSVGALGDVNAGTLAYQWLFDGNILPGQTNATLTLTNISSASVGAYSVRVSNLAGAVTSSSAYLTLLGANMYAGLTIVGNVGSSYRIEGRTLLSSNWVVLTNLVLPSSPYLFFDASSIYSTRKFYRAILQ